MRLLLLGGLLLGLCQCGPSKTINYKRPQNVVRAYYQALEQNDFERLLRLGTPEMQGTINLLYNMYNLLPEEERNNLKSSVSVQKIKKITCEIQENTAICKACCDTKGKSLEGPITLKRINKQWLVHWQSPSLDW